MFYPKHRFLRRRWRTNYLLIWRITFATFFNRRKTHFRRLIIDSAIDVLSPRFRSQLTRSICESRQLRLSMKAVLNRKPKLRWGEIVIFLHSVSYLPQNWNNWSRLRRRLLNLSDCVSTVSSVNQWHDLFGSFSNWAAHSHCSVGWFLWRLFIILHLILRENFRHGHGLAMPCSSLKSFWLVLPMLFVLKSSLLLGLGCLMIVKMISHNSLSPTLVSMHGANVVVTTGWWTCVVYGICLPFVDTSNMNYGDDSSFGYSVAWWKQKRKMVE